MSDETPKGDNVIDLIEQIGGKITEVGIMPDGSGFALASFDLPKDHWIYRDGFDEPPTPFLKGTSDPDRKDWENKLRAVARYAVRAATMNGKEDDFDPDAMVQNFIIGALGYYTEDGKTSIL